MGTTGKPQPEADEPKPLHPDIIRVHQTRRTIASMYTPEFRRFDTPALNGFRLAAQVRQIEREARVHIPERKQV